MDKRAQIEQLWRASLSPSHLAAPEVAEMLKLQLKYIRNAFMRDIKTVEERQSAHADFMAATQAHRAVIAHVTSLLPPKPILVEDTTL